MNSGFTFFRYLDELSEFTGIHKSELFDECYDIYTSLNISATDLLQIAINLNVDPILLWNKQIDLEQLRLTRAGQTVLPFAYSEVCASNIASLKNSLDTFKKYGMYDYALKRIQMNEKTIQTINSISVMAMTDLFRFSDNFFIPQDYMDIATRNAAFTYDNILRKEINTRNTGIRITQNIFELVCHFEQNWNYKIIRSDLHSLTIETKESELMRSTKSYRSFTTNTSNLVRFTFIKAALAKFNINTQNVTQLSDSDNKEKKFRFSVNIH